MYNYKEKATPQTRACDREGCEEGGTCRAPKNRAQVDGRAPADFFWFCPTHAREYNTQWDYFSGMNSEEILAFQKDAVTGHRPTWNFHVPPHMAAEAIMGRMRGFMDSGDIANLRANIPPPIPAKYKQALDHLGLSHPVSQQTIRDTYRALVKKTHPDVNKGDKAAEERFKIIGNAYRLLKKEYGDHAA